MPEPRPTHPVVGGIRYHRDGYGNPTSQQYVVEWTVAGGSRRWCTNGCWYYLGAPMPPRDVAWWLRVLDRELQNYPPA